MKREIKFRAWDGREMLKDWLVISESNGTKIPTTLARKAEVVMQFIGLLDKNGKEIYEGDIVEVRMAEDYGGEFDEDGKLRLLCRQEVKISKESGGYYSEEDTGEYCPALGSDEIEVEIIGNFYENPELIK